MPLKEQIQALIKLGAYMQSDDEQWTAVKDHAERANPWFTKDQVEEAVAANAALLTEEQLTEWISRYSLPQSHKTVGIVMAGNIPMVGFNDWLCGYISGHNIRIKLSSKDSVLIKHLNEKLAEWDGEVAERIQFAENLKGCDAYIATGSNNTSRYFEQYFGKYPHIIRRNRTSVALLDGSESTEELKLLAKDIFTYYGLGCRNVTQICVPRGYDFIALLDACRSYDDYINHHKYKNNYDYHLAIYLLNKVQYMSNEVLLLVENELSFSAVSVLHYRYYDDKAAMLQELETSGDIQAIVSKKHIPFGMAQSPALTDYADGVDTMAFLCSL